MPDTSRAARFVLKDYVNAKIVFCRPPTGIDVDEYMTESRAKTIDHLETLERLGRKRAPITRVVKGADTYTGAGAPNLDDPTPAQQEKTAQMTSRSVKSTAASAPSRSARGQANALEKAFFDEAGPSARIVAKGAPGLGQEAGYNRTKLYPHARMIGNDGLPVGIGATEPNPAANVKRGDKKHFKIKDGKKRSGKGYD